MISLDLDIKKDRNLQAKVSFEGVTCVLDTDVLLLLRVLSHRVYIFTP